MSLFKRSDDEPTSDTPAERDEKARVLAVEAEELAEILRQERLALARVVAEATAKNRREGRMLFGLQVLVTLVAVALATH